MLAQRYTTAVHEDQRSLPARATKARPSKASKAPDSYARKSIKVNAVSKASLAMLDPRHAMGIDVGLEWHEAPTLPYRNGTSFEDEASASSSKFGAVGRHVSAGQDALGSPTPELEAFTTSIDDFGSSSSQLNGRVEAHHADASVFEDDVRAAPPTGLDGGSPRRKPAKLDLESPSRGGKKGSSSIARFFTWKKKDKQIYTNLAGCRSTSDLFDPTVPQSAPPTMTHFDIHNHALPLTSRMAPEDDFTTSLPCSPERQQAGLPREYGSVASLQSGTSIGSLPPLREIRAAVAERKSMYNAKEQQNRFARDIAPALPQLNVNIATSSPMMPELLNRWGLYSPEQEARSPSSPSRQSTYGGRNVSSVGRGVPGRDRKSTIILKSESEVRRELMSRAPPLPTAAASAHHPATSRRPAGHARRTSIAKHVVEGLLIENHGREEPTLPSQTVAAATLGVRANRRRSRSVETRAPPSLASFGLASTAISETEASAADTPIFPCSFQHETQTRAQRLRQSVATQVANSVVVPAASSRPPRRAPASPVRTGRQVPAISTCDLDGGKTHQARRVNLSNQRARAVAVTSPSLITRSPRMALPLPVVNIMPPTPEPELDGVSASSVADQTDARVAAAINEATVSVRAVAEPAAPIEPTVVAEPETVSSPTSLYSPRSVYEEGRFSHAYGGLDGIAVSKEEMEIVTAPTAVGRERTYSISSDLSSSGSSTSGAFGFSDSLSSSSLVSGGSFSSISSLMSESPERSGPAASKEQAKMPKLPEIVITSTTSLQSLMTAGTADDEAESDAEATTAAAPAQPQLRTPFHFQSGRKSPCDESDDCETPTLASCRRMSSRSQAMASRQGEDDSKRLDLDMDLSELAQELGLGRLSCILPPSSAALNAESKKKASPPKPPKSQARSVSQWRRSISREAEPPVEYATTSPLSFGGGNTQAPLTPPRTPFGQTAAGNAASEHDGKTFSAAVAENVPTAPGGMGLGLDFGMEVGSVAYSSEADDYNHHHGHHGQFEEDEEAEFGFAL